MVLKGKHLRLMLCIALISSIFAEDEKKSELKNVQVLSYTTKAEIMKFMKKSVTKELGVKCNYCHNIKDYASDEKEQKIVSREMMRMVKHINTTTMKPLGLHEVSCWVCHQGKKHPDHKC
jgi:hypothetical protein